MVAGRQLFELLKKLHLERPGRTLLTGMPRAIQAYHDVPTPSGYFPSQIVFWRDCIERGLPWATPGRGLDCKVFMAKAEKIVVTLTEALTKEHKKRLHHLEKTPVAKYKVRDTVRL